MIRCTFSAAFLVGMLVPISSSAESPPASSFDHYAVKSVFTGRTTLPDFKGRDRAYRDYRTRIRDGLNDGPNFAGENSVIQIGCGTGCSFVYIANNKTGQVFDFPRGGEENLHLQLSFKLRSRLIVAQWGSYDADSCVVEFWEWVKESARLISNQKIGVEKACYEDIEATLASLWKTDAQKVESSALDIVDDDEGLREAHIRNDVGATLVLVTCKPNENTIGVGLSVPVDATVPLALGRVRAGGVGTTFTLQTCFDNACTIQDFKVDEYFGYVLADMSLQRLRRAGTMSIVVSPDVVVTDQGALRNALEEICNP